MSELVAIDREGEEHRIKGIAGWSVMELLRDAGLPVSALCGGVISCATCHVHVRPEFFPSLPRISPDERDLLEMSSFYEPGRSRLSCQIPFSDLLDGLVVTLAPED